MNDDVNKPIRSQESEAVQRKWIPAGMQDTLTTWPVSPVPGLDAKCEGQRGTESIVSDTEPPVDLGQLADAAVNDPTELHDLVALYFNQSEKMLAQLKKAVEARATSEIREITHKLVGSSATCGMTLMVAFLRKLEAQIQNDALGDALTTFEEVQQSFERTRQFIADYLQALDLAAPHQQTERAQFPRT